MIYVQTVPVGVGGYDDILVEEGKTSRRDLKTFLHI